MMKRTKTEREKGRKGEKENFSFPKSLVIFSIAATVLLGFACQPNQTVLKDVAPSPTPMETIEQRKTTLEEDLNEMRTANFGFIFVFRRKDGGEFDKEDQKFLRENTPPETNRWRRSDDGKAFIAGSWYTFTPEQLTALRTRFNIEDFSTPQAKAAANKAFNSQTNSSSNAANQNSNNGAVKTPNGGVQPETDKSTNRTAKP